MIDSAADLVGASDFSELTGGFDGTASELIEALKERKSGEWAGGQCREAVPSVPRVGKLVEVRPATDALRH